MSLELERTGRDRSWWRPHDEYVEAKRASPLERSAERGVGRLGLERHHDLAPPAPRPCLHGTVAPHVEAAPYPTRARELGAVDHLLNGLEAAMKERDASAARVACERADALLDER